MKNTSPVILSLLTTFGFFGCIFWMLKWGFPPENKDQLNQLIGVLGTIWTLQMNYTFGSSASSSKKDDTMGEIARQVTGTVATGTGSGIGDRANNSATTEIPAKDVNIKAEAVTVTEETGGKNG